MIDIAVEMPADAAPREMLLDRVMGRARRAKPSERLRENRRPSRGLSFVAHTGGEVVGTVRLWDVHLGGAHPALLLGPLAVDRRFQSSGIGSALMDVALTRADALGHEAVILVGEPDYYRRFGFSRSLTSGLWMLQATDRRKFLGLELSPGGLAGASGLVRPDGLCVENNVPLFMPGVVTGPLTNHRIAA
jgi:predicted N-acetyltransferase YhbS